LESVHGIKKMNHPIIIGAGQITHRQKISGDSPIAFDLAQMAIEASVKDTGRTDILEMADILTLVNMFSETGERPVDRLCNKLGIRPVIREDTAIGGNTPQWLVNRAADKIARGESKIIILAGAEAFYRENRLAPIFTKESLGKSIKRLQKDPAVIGDTRSGTTPYEESQGVTHALRIYPLFENALRRHLHMDPEEHRAFLLRYHQGMAAVASGNPYAWSNTGILKEDIATATQTNPIINYPYTKYMNPNPAVNQAAALILTDTDTAKQLSISREKWVYPHSGAEAADKWFISERINYHSSPAIRMIVAASLKAAGFELPDIDFFDLYSCFPCAVIIAAQAIGLPIDDLSLFSITGGLSYFGGPGNNYTMHAIAHAVERLRKRPEERGLITGLGWFLTKHAVGIYSGVAPKTEWRREAGNAVQAGIDAMVSPMLCKHPNGSAVVETYTVMHDTPDGHPFSIIIARLDSGERCFATTESGHGLALQMEQEEFIGRRGRVCPGENGSNIFSIEGRR
jgi:acetyl-CoA C-acetyltransferase